MPADSLAALFADFNCLTVLIIGDVMVDAYIWGRAGRISPEAPVPVVNVSRTEQRLGGAANVALNVQALGATPLLCAVVGDDRGGDELLELLKTNGLAADGIIRSPHRPTTVKQRILAAGQHLLRLDSEVETELNDDEQAQLLARYERPLTRADVVIFEDYDKGRAHRHRHCPLHRAGPGQRHPHGSLIPSVATSWPMRAAPSSSPT